MTRLRIAIVGYGRHAAHVLVPALMQLPVEVVALCEPDGERAEEYLSTYRTVPVFEDVEKGIQEARPEAIVAAANPRVHFQAARAGMTAGCNVFVEKAPVESAAQARELAGIEAATGRWVMAGFNRRWATAYRLAAEAIRRPALAGVRLYYARYHAGDYGSEERLLSNHLIHHLDLALWLCGDIEELFTRRLAISAGKIAFDTSFKTSSGAIGTIQCASMQSSSFPQEHLEMLGDGWEVVVDNHQNVQFNRDTRRPSERLHDAPVALDDGLDTIIWNQNRTMFPPTLFQDNGFEIELEHFVRCCRDGTAPAFGAREIVRTMELLEAFRASAESGRAVRPAREPMP